MKRKEDCALCSSREVQGRHKSERDFLERPLAGCVQENTGCFDPSQQLREAGAGGVCWHTIYSNTCRSEDREAFTMLTPPKVPMTRCPVCDATGKTGTTLGFGGTVCALCHGTCFLRSEPNPCPCCNANVSEFRRAYCYAVGRKTISRVRKKRIFRRISRS